MTLSTFAEMAIMDTYQQTRRDEMNEKLEQEAMELSKELESTVRFSKEWFDVMKKVETWTKENDRPLYITYNED